MFQDGDGRADLNLGGIFHRVASMSHGTMIRKTSREEFDGVVKIREITVSRWREQVKIRRGIPLWKSVARDVRTASTALVRLAISRPTSTPP